MTKFSETYPTDLKYTEWELIAEFFPPHIMGRPRKWEIWQIINGILYVNRTGCQWRMLLYGLDRKSPGNISFHMDFLKGNYKCL